MRGFCILIALLSSPAFADNDEAHAAYQNGTAAYDRKDFSTALAEFQRAYMLKEDPNTLLRIALTEQQLGRNVHAEELIRYYLRTAPNLSAETINKAMAETEPKPPYVAPPKRLHRLWPAGLVFASTGLASVCTAAGLLASAANNGADAKISYSRSLFDSYHAADLTDQKAGWPLLGVGIAAMVTGAVLIIVSLKTGTTRNIEKRGTHERPRDNDSDRAPRRPPQPEGR